MHVVVLTGNGGAFGAGQDLKEMAQLVTGEALPAGAATGFRGLLDVLQRFDKPIVAAVNGVGVGLGFTILMHCDLVLAADDARIRVPFTELGVPPEAASSYLFPRTMGWQRAARLVFTSDWVSGPEAVELGVALACVPAARLLDEALALASRPSWPAPLDALMAAKRLLPRYPQPGGHGGPRTGRRRLCRAARFGGQPRRPRPFCRHRPPDLIQRAVAITPDDAMEHVVLVLFENRSFDNLLGRLYAPGEVPAFEGVIGKNLSNPVPAWAEHPAEGGVVAYGVTTDMDAPDPDPGEEYPHTNTQLFNVLDEDNRFKDATEMHPTWNAPPDGQVPTMDGFVTDYISFLTVELGRQPTYDEYRQIMTGFTPEQVPVLSALAKGFGVFDHWFCEVPSQTMANRSFWTAATSSGFVVNRPFTNFMRHNNAETIFERLEQHGRSWKVYVLEPDPMSFTGLIHHGRLHERFATHFASFSEFERDAAAGTLPHFSLVEPNLMAGHCDYHPAFGKALLPGLGRRDRRAVVGSGRRSVPGPPLPGRAPAPRRRLERCSTRCSSWGGTSPAAPMTTCPRVRCRHRIRVRRPGSSAFASSGPATGCPPSSCRPGSRRGSVYSEEYRHTSLLATLRQHWELGAPFSGRDAAARTFDHRLRRTTPRDPDDWPDVHSRPVPAYQQEKVDACQALGALGRHLCHGLFEHARHTGDLPAPPATDPDVSPALAVDFAIRLGARLFPGLARRPD